MAWRSRVNWSAQDNRPTWQDLNSWGLDLRTWGGNVDAGGYSLANVFDVAASGMVKIVQGGDTKAKFTHSSGVTWLTSEGATYLRIGINNGTRVSIDSSGRVGIGIDQADRLLHLKANSLEMVFEENTAAANNRKWRIITGGNSWALETINDNISAAVTALIAYRSGTTLSAVAIPNCGLGIGTPAPATPLHVKSTSNALMRLESLGSDVYLQMASPTAWNTISMDAASGIYVGGGTNAAVFIRNCDGGWGHQAKFDGVSKRIYFYGLPSSSAGLTSGAIWYDPADGNRLKYVP